MKVKPSAPPDGDIWNRKNVCTDAPAGSGRGVASQALPAWLFEFGVSWRTLPPACVALPLRTSDPTLVKSQKVPVTARAGAASTDSARAESEAAARRTAGEGKGPRRRVRERRVGAYRIPPARDELVATARQGVACSRRARSRSTTTGISRGVIFW